MLRTWFENEYIERCKELAIIRQERDALAAEVQALTLQIKEMCNLIYESYGVVGLRRDIALWEDILPGGRYEWLSRWKMVT